MVPDDTHEGVDPLLKDIWIDQKWNEMPASYATYNVAMDKYVVANTFADIRADLATLRLTTVPHTEIHQDTLHARERVATTLNKGHPDYYGALPAGMKSFGRSIG